MSKTFTKMELNPKQRVSLQVPPFGRNLGFTRGVPGVWGSTWIKISASPKLRGGVLGRGYLEWYPLIPTQTIKALSGSLTVNDPPLRSKWPPPCIWQNLSEGAGHLMLNNLIPFVFWPFFECFFKIPGVLIWWNSRTSLHCPFVENLFFDFAGVFFTFPFTSPPTVVSRDLLTCSYFVQNYTKNRPENLWKLSPPTVVAETS